MYLFKNYQVRSVLVGERPHPFADYERLNQYWSSLGYGTWIFDPTKTFAMLDVIRENGHLDFHAELNELLWFGGVVSYGNILRETYAIIYSWIDEKDLPDLEGIAEDDDGVTFRNVVTKSLRIVRAQHTQEVIARLYNDLDSAKLIMRSRGMTAYFSQLNKIRIDMRKQGELVSEAYLLRRTYLAIAGKHKKLDESVAELRRVAGVSGVPTKFAHASDHLVDTFDFEIPDSAKTETTSEPNVPVNSATTEPPKRERDALAATANDDQPSTKRKRKTFPKGSCKNCPNSTSHTTPYCYKTRRRKMGLPKGWSWCTKHKFGTHYDHTCRRHAPNYPNAPKINCADVANEDDSALSASTIAAQVASLIGMNGNSSKAIKVTPPESANFQLARNASANIATDGPPASVSQIMGKILGMNKLDRQLLTSRLAKAGL